jgi:glucosyl-dolichyl phosphate glucuronosyltransferase
MQTTSPLISVIICTYNRYESLARTLEGLAQLRVPPELMWELIIIDNNSSDQTLETVKSFMSRDAALRLKYVFEPVPGLSQARNRGIRESQGTILAFLDDDVIVARDWLIEVRNAFQQYDPACVGGRVLLRENSPRPSWWDAAYDGPVGKFDRGTSTIIYEESYEGLVGIGANIMFNRIAFEKYGLFRTDLGKKVNHLTSGEDSEMVQRLKKQKQRIIYYPNALVYHCPSAERFSKRYLRQHFHGLGQWNFVKELDGPNPCPRILGIPRWRYRLVLTDLWKTVLLGLRGRHTESFVYQLHFSFFLGYFKAAQNLKKPAQSGIPVHHQSE